MISVFGWPDLAFEQSEHVLYTCYFINKNINCVPVTGPTNITTALRSMHVTARITK